MYHYTSRAAAQNIHCTTLLKPGADGFLYLTTDDYSYGAEAANFLAIRFKPIEERCELEIDENDPQLERLDDVLPVHDDFTGELIRSGMGVEYRIPRSFSITQLLSWKPLEHP